jgi:large subunit ribosomal protein L2
VQSGPDVGHQAGNALPLGDIPTGTIVHAVELRPGQGAQARALGGSGVQLVAKDAPTRPAPALRRDAPRPAHLPRDRRPGRQLRPRNESSGKAGRSRWLGKRPPCAAPR